MTVGLEPTVRMLNRRDCQPGRSLVSHKKATDEISATGGRRRLSLIDVNDVLSHHGRNYKPLSTGQQEFGPLKSTDSAFRQPSDELLKMAVYPSVYAVHKCRTQPYTTPAVHKNGHQILLWCRCCITVQTGCNIPLQSAWPDPRRTVRLVP